MLKNTWTRTWLFGLSCILLTLLLIGYNCLLQRHILLHDAQDDIASLVNLIERDLARTFSGLDQIFMGLENDLTQGSTLGKIDPPEVKRVIDNLVLDNNYLTSLMVLDQSGQILYWNGNYQKPDFSQSSYFQVHKQNFFHGLFFSLPQASPFNKGQWTFGVSKAIRSNDHSLSMVTAAIIDLRYFDLHYRPMLTSPGTSLTISSPAGDLYTSVSNGENIPEHQQPGLAATNGKVIESDQQLSITKQVGNYPLLVTLAIDKTTALSSWRVSLLNAVILGLLISLTMLFMTWRMVLQQRHQQRHKEELYKKVGIDPLTKLVDQLHILDQAKFEIKKAARTQATLSVILLNLDHFRTINDNYGRQLGDEVLQSTAVVLRECSRETDILGRYGGVNFLFLLPATELQGAIVI